MSVIARAAAHTLCCFLGVSSANTQTSEAERDAIRRYANGKRRSIEIGVFEGASTRLIAECMHPDGKLYGIDPFFKGRIGVCWSELIARREVWRSGSAQKVLFTKALSHAAAEIIQGRFDFIFIDGDHSLSGIQQDWNDWSARLERHGIIILHDTEVPTHNLSVAQLGSYKFFQDCICHDERFEILETIDSLNVLRRL